MKELIELFFCDRCNDYQEAYMKKEAEVLSISTPSSNHIHELRKIIFNWVDSKLDVEVVASPEKFFIMTDSDFIPYEYCEAVRLVEMIEESK